MVSRIFIKCRVCGEISLVRFQVGWLDAMPFAFACNKCEVIIRGRLIQDQNEAKLSLTLENADEVKGGPDPKNISQEVECSGEFPVQRFTKGTLGEIRPSPYILSFSAMGGENYLSFKSNILSYIEFFKSKMTDFVSLVELYSKRDFPNVKKMLNEHFDGKIKGDDTSDTISGFYDQLSGVTRLILPPDHFENVTISLFKNFGKSFRSDKQEQSRYVDYLYDEIKIHEIEASGLSLLMRFLGKFEYFLPVVGLSYWPAGRVNRPLGTKYLITTTDFETIKQLYADSYEWLYQYLPILVGAENISRRGNYDKLPSFTEKGHRQLSSLTEFILLDNGIKKQLVNQANMFPGFVISSLDNRIRNAINHYKTKLHSVDQRIEYFPYKTANKIDKPENIYLIDLTESCYWQFGAIHDLLYIMGAIHCFKYD